MRTWSPSPLPFFRRRRWASLRKRDRPPTIGFLPAGDEQVASSRMRVYAIARVLATRHIPIVFSDAPSVDVLVVQKKLTTERLESALQAQERGCLLVYDVDDLGDALWYWAPPALFERMVRAANLVITASAAQRDYLMTEYSPRRAAAVPCPIDYFPSAPTSPQLRAAPPLRVLWFGSRVNFHLLEPYLEPLLAKRDVQAVVIVDGEAIGELARRYPPIEFMPWSLESFAAVLRGCDLTLLMHDGSPADRAKSNTKMVTSVAWGVPAVVSWTPEYERTAVELGVEEAVFDGQGDFGRSIEALRGVASRAAYLELAQPRVWRRYSAVAVADEFLQALESAAGGAIGPRDFRGLGRALPCSGPSESPASKRFDPRHSSAKTDRCRP